jgi:hypothetical protein
MEAILSRVLTGNLLYRSMGSFVEGVDYADKVQEKLTAREMALRGRGQDLARLTAEGVPDTSAPLVALKIGAAKGHGANLEPVLTALVPGLAPLGLPLEAALIASRVVAPAAPLPWGMKQEQPAVKAPFGNSANVEGIPFLTKFPRLDGDLSDWGRIRPLILRGGAKGEALLVYAAWNYQGFFFGYEVKEAAERFYYPSFWVQTGNHNTGDVGYQRVEGAGWAYKGDYFRLLFDTLDARNANRGEPHTQEFVIFPQGTESDAEVPGIERVIASQRDAKTKEYRGVKASCNIFLQQPPGGPDGTGPYRVTQATGGGYTLEVFVPRTLFKEPVFAPGWYVGFDCAVAVGVQEGLDRLSGQYWASGRGDNPERWGDLLLLGTDAQMVVQEANAAGTVASSLVPGHSYLVTVVDPDRNVNAAGLDTVLVSVEVNGGEKDVEVLILKETGNNTGVFRGYLDTQPGVGRQMQGVAEMLPLQEVRLGYVDFANARGQRTVVSELRLPVVAAVTQLAKAGEGR